MSAHRLFSYLLFIALAAYLVYANALKNDFAWDDTVLIVENAQIKDIRNIPKLFFTDILATEKSNFYRPLQGLSNMLDYHIFGLRPWGYHLTNILLHLINGILAFFLIKAISKNVKASFFAALLFVIHPAQTEAVTYISGRADLLYSLFLLLTIFLFMKGSPFGLLTFAFSLLSKEAAVVTPFLLLLLLHCCPIQRHCEESAEGGRLRGEAEANPQPRNWIPRFARNRLRNPRRDCLPSGKAAGFAPSGLAMTRKPVARNDGEGSPLGVLRDRWIELSFYFFILAIYAALRLTLLDFSAGGIFRGNHALFQRLLVALKAIPFYLGILFFPVNLHMARSFPIPKSIFDPMVLAGALILVILCVAICILIRAPHPNPLPFGERIKVRGSSAPCFFILWFILALLPSMNIVELNAPMAEHWLYLASIGIFAAVSSKLTIIHGMIVNLGRGRWIYAIILPVLFFFGVQTIRRNADWRDSKTILENTLEYSPANTKVLQALGEVYLDLEKYDKAERFFKKALEHSPYIPACYSNLGFIYYHKGDRDSAVRMWRRAIQLAADFAMPYFNIGCVMEERGEIDRATNYYVKAVQLDPDNLSFRSRLKILRPSR